MREVNNKYIECTYSHDQLDKLFGLKKLKEIVKVTSKKLDIGDSRHAKKVMSQMSDIINQKRRLEKKEQEKLEREMAKK